MTKIQICTLLLFSILIVVLASCKDNSVSVSAAGERGQVTGSWMPLSEGDTLEVYVRLENQIHLGDPAFEVTRIPEAHLSTFQVWTDSNYARDSLNVYYPIETECIVVDGKTACYATSYIVEGAVAPTFRYLGNEYGTDGNELYFRGKILRGSNNEGF